MNDKHVCINDGCSKPNKFAEGKSGYECNTCAITRSRYGINSVEREELLSQQGGKCAICDSEIIFKNTNKGKRDSFAVVDHCHEHNFVRGILCTNCNVGIGLLKDNIDNLVNAIVYLKGNSR